MEVYFDNAATTFPKPEVVYEFMNDFYRRHGGNAGRGQYKIAAEASRLISETRKYIQTILSCPNKDVIFAPSATIALNQIIQGSIADVFRTVYISPFEHNAVTRVLWNYESRKHIRVKSLPLDDNYRYDLDKMKEEFRNTPPDIVIMSHASNVCGKIAPIEDIFACAKQYQALTIVDMAQTAGLVSLNVGLETIDYAVFAGHKTLYGPTGIGGFVKSPTVQLRPILFGGTGVDSANQNMPSDLPYRYEPGSMNILSVSGLHASLKWLLDNRNDVFEQDRKNHVKLLDILRSYDNIRIVGPVHRDDCIGVVSCVFDNYSSDDIGHVMDKLGVAVRTGLTCSPLAHKTLGSFPAGAVRFSPGYFTQDSDFEKLKEVLDYIDENA